jgi:hypothetical protein
MTLLKRILKKTPFYSIRLNAIKKNQLKKAINEWEANGKDIPPPQFIKHLTIKKFAVLHNIKILVETGTYLGETLEACKSHFKQLISIELDQNLYQVAVEKFANDKQIQICQGDSGQLIENILNDINQPCLFWLDGHYSEGITAKGDLNTPVMNELKHILNHHIKSHVILIDDARCFIGKDDYPTIPYLINFVKQFNQNLNLIVEDDIIRIYA